MAESSGAEASAARFHAMFAGAEAAAASFDAMFAGVSLQSLLLDHSLHHPFFFFSDHYGNGNDSALPVVDNGATATALTLRLPKPEPLDISDEPLPLLQHSAPPAIEPVQSLHFAAQTAAAAAVPRRASASRNNNNQLARERRRRISDKMKFLKRLMPWKRKMDTATMLEEAYNYILFLESQVTALYSIPAPADNDATDYTSGMNRQQTLEVLVNSPPAQGQCLVKAEQLEDHLAEDEEEEATRAAYQQQQQTMMMLFESSSSSVSNFY